MNCSVDYTVDSAYSHNLQVLAWDPVAETWAEVGKVSAEAGWQATKMIMIKMIILMMTMMMMRMMRMMMMTMMMMTMMMKMMMMVMI